MFEFSQQRKVLPGSLRLANLMQKRSTENKFYYFYLDGQITLRLAKSLLQLNNNIMLNVFATETSYIMKDRLREKDITVINDIRELENVHFISCLNVLDRCKCFQVCR